MARLIIVEDNAELASLLSAAATTHGYQVHVVHNGRDALAALEAGGFDVALVDLLLPDLPGTEILDALRGGPTRAVLMSGMLRDPASAREAVEVHGADAVFVKPFDVIALLAELDRLTGAEPPVQEPGLDDFSELDVLAPLDEEPFPPEGTEQAPPEADDDFELPFARRQQVWARARRNAGTGELPAWTKAGPLQAGSVPRLLTAYYQARHSGELRLTQGPLIKVVYFEAGVPVYAASNLAGERFARFCARRGLFAEDELPTIAALAKESNLRTGEAMVELGLVTAEQRRELLVEQVKEILWSTFAWDKGDFSFSPRRPRAQDLVKLTVFPGDLILEGVRRAESLLALRRKLPEARRLFPHSDPAFELHQLALDGEQARLLAYADGSKTVADLCALTELSEREALATLWGLTLLGVLEERAEERARRRISFGL